MHRALEAAGGIGSPGGSCLWHVLGCGCSIREWAVRQSWNGRPVRQELAQGILIAALGILASLLGYSGQAGLADFNEQGFEDQSVLRPG